MKATTADQAAVGHEDQLVHAWRVLQLTRLGIPGSLAEIYADRWTGTRSPS